MYVKSRLIQIFILLFGLSISSIASEEIKLFPGSYFDTITNKSVILNADTIIVQPIVYFSNKTIVWLDDNTELKIDREGFEHEKDSTDFYFTINVNYGDAYFKLNDSSETSTMTVNTSCAELEIHSSEFSVESAIVGIKSISFVRCYTGYITITNPDTLKEIKVEAGYQASITGNEDDKNQGILIGKIDRYEMNKWQRIKIDSIPLNIDWVQVGEHYEIKHP